MTYIHTNFYIPGSNGLKLIPSNRKLHTDFRRQPFCYFKI